MSALVEAVEQIAATITAATGIHATADPGKIVLPCALVNPPDLDFTIMGGGGQAEIAVLLLASGPWNLDALASLSDMLTAVNGIDALAPIESASPGQYALPSGGSVPCYRLVYRMAVTW